MNIKHLLVIQTNVFYPISYNIKIILSRKNVEDVIYFIYKIYTVHSIKLMIDWSVCRIDKYCFSQNVCVTSTYFCELLYQLEFMIAAGILLGISFKYELKGQNWCVNFELNIVKSIICKVATLYLFRFIDITSSTPFHFQNNIRLKIYKYLYLT